MRTKGEGKGDMEQDASTTTETAAAAPGVASRLRDVRWRELVSLRSIGFALARAWVYLMFIGAAASRVTWNGNPIPDVVFGISTVCLFLTMFLPAFRAKEFCACMSKPHVRWVVPALLCSGTLAVVSSTLSGVPAQILCVYGGVATGVGSGLLDLGYGELYRNVPSRQTAFEAPFAFLLAAVVYFVSWWLPPVGACLLACAIPLISSFILFGPLGVWSPASQPAVRPVPISIAKFAVRVGVCACLVGLADGMVRAVFIAAGGMGMRDLYHVPFLIASVITVVIIWGSLIVRKTFDLRWIYKVTVGIMAFVFQLLPIFVGTGLQSVLALAGYGTFNVLIWMLLADITYTYRLSSVTVFGIGWSMITLGVLLGSLAGSVVVAAFSPFSPRMLSIVALGATCAVLCSYMFVLKESDLVKMTASAESAEDAADKATSSASSEDGAPRPPRFVSRCRDIAERYGLTERETEVMISYAKGRSYARLQEELHASRGTVTTHLRHIYQKLDIHSKQELLDLIEGRVAPQEEGESKR